MSRLLFIIGFVVIASICLHFVKDDINAVVVKLQNRNSDFQAYTKENLLP